MSQNYFQDSWPEELSYCFGCGRNNKHGLHIKSYWKGEEALCNWMPKDHLKAGEDILCGGIIATIIDCHCLNTAIAQAYKQENRKIGTEPFIPFATGTIKIELLRPVSLQKSIILKAKVKEIKKNKIYVSCDLFSNNILCAKGEISAIRVENDFWKKKNSK
ncbi:MAG: PaaI family thioesterase [Candidatus Lokiarchaeota archaeon]|nr:PaaI family thioesterase [Candidatus Lokiarchaeota archaeon]